MFEKEKPTIFEAHTMRPDCLIAWFVWPCFMAAMMLATWYLYHSGLSLNILIPLLTTVNFLILLALEYILPARQEMGVMKDWQSINDAMHGVITGLIRPFGTSIGLLLVLYTSDWRQQTGLATLWPTEWPLIAQLILAQLIHGFFSYWAHRLLHTVNFLWWFHALHHDTNQMHVLKAGRFHFGDEIFNALITAAPLVMLGAPKEVLLLRSMWTVYSGAIEHANVIQRFPSWFHYLSNNAQLHNLHHSMNRKYQDGNYSGVPIYDVIFGTFNHPDKCDIGQFGIREQYVPTGLLAQLWFPFRAQFISPVNPPAFSNQIIKE
jgi:sterol desaturase/sphingolipid hydroxylase (fatty acid hydroxylase superfamily)